MTPHQDKNRPGPVIALLLLPALYTWKVQTFGTLIPAEILAAAFGLYLLPGTLLDRTNGAFRALLICALVWLGFQVLTDILRGSSRDDYLRGWARVSFFITNSVVLWRLIGGRIERILWFAIGCGFAGLIAAIFEAGFELNAYSWKMGWMVPITYGFIILACGCGGLWRYVLPLIAAILSIALQGRSLGGVCVATSIFLFVSSHIPKNLQQRARRPLSAALLLGVICIVSVIVGSALFSFAARSGVLGEALRDKSELQQERAERYIDNRVYSALLVPIIGGRPEVIVSSQAIIDSPVLGHGSWAKDPKYLELFAWLGGVSYEQTLAENTDAAVPGVIPTHSHLFGSWVDAGLGGGFFWIMFVLFLLEALVVLLFYHGRSQPVIAFMLINSAWDVFFSPFDTPRRLLVAAVLAAAAVVLKSSAKEHWISGWMKQQQLATAQSSARASLPIRAPNNIR